MILEAKILYDIAKEVVKANIAKANKKLQRNHKVLKVLESLGLSELKADFDSIYAHTLVQFGVDRQPDALIELFWVDNVKNAIKAELFRNEEKFISILDSELHTNKNLTNLKKDYKNVADLENDWKEFISIYEGFVMQTSKPFLLNQYNKLNLSLLQLIKDNQRKSFDYQVKEYLKTEKISFKEKFIDNNHYVPLNGEQRMVSFERKHLQEKDDMLSAMEREREKVVFSPIDLFFNRWLNDPNQNFLLIIGEFGTGKSTYVNYLSYTLSNSIFQEEENSSLISDQLNRLPILFPLRDFEKTIEQFMTHHLNNKNVTDITYADYLSRVDKNEIVTIFDGFDEMTQRIDADEKKYNFARIKSIIDHSANSKVILTCREEYFQTEDEIESIFNLKANHNYQLIYLNSFNDEQIKRYLKGHTENPEFYWAKINNIFDLKDLAKRPVLLDLIIKYLPKIQKEKDESISILDLYKACFTDELDRKNKELPFNFNIPNKNRFEILKRLAAWMFQNDTLTFDTRIIGEELKLKELFEIQQQESWKFESCLNEFLNFTFLIREGNDYQYRISHKSFRDYLAAVVWVEELKNKKPYFFSKTESTDELRKFIIVFNLDKDYLLELVLTAKNLQEDKIWQGTNAANILLLLDANALSGQNLSDCIIRNVPLIEEEVMFNDGSFSIEKSINLKNTVLYNTDLSGCKFGENILESSTFQNAIFNESKFLCRESTLQNINFLEEMRDLTELNLYRVNIEDKDVSVIKYLKKLNRLNLCGTKVKDIAFIKELRNIAFLILFNSGIKDISSLENLSALEHLALVGNKVNNIKALQQLTNLKHLALGESNIEDLSPIASLFNLSYLYIDSNKKVDVSHLKDLIYLQTLYIPNNNIKVISDLIHLTNLTRLSIDSNNITDISTLKDLTNLTTVNISKNTITDISAIKDLTNLITLNISNNNITDISALNDLTNLTTLNISKNTITDISAINDLTNLTTLNISKNNITDISALKDLTNLEWLFISKNNISDFSCVKELKYLKYIYVSKALHKEEIEKLNKEISVIVED